MASEACSGFDPSTIARFHLYDLDADGAISKREILKLIHGCASGSTEKDLLEFLRHRGRAPAAGAPQPTPTPQIEVHDHYMFDDYAAHVRDNGEHDGVTHFRRCILE